MTDINNFAIEIKIDTTGIPLLLKLLAIPLHTWNFWLKLKHKLLKKPPIKINIKVGD